MLEPVLSNPWVRAAGALVAIALVSLLVYFLSPVLVPLFFAFLVAYIFDPVVDMFEARKIPRTGSIAILATLGIVGLVALPVFVVPGIIEQADSLMAAARQSADADEDKTPSWFRTQLDRLPLESLVEALDMVPVDDAEYDPISVLTVQVAERIRAPAVNFLKNNASGVGEASQKAGAGIGQILAKIGGGLVGVLLFFGNVALFAFVAVYLLRDYDQIVATAKDLMPPKYRKYTFSITSKIDQQLRSFLRGQMLVCAFLGAMYAAGLLIAGVPFALLIAGFGAVASFIPYVGIALTASAGLILCLLQHQVFDWHIMFVAGTFIVAQVLEGTVITPKIVGEQVGLGPVWVILAVLVFGNALGFLGLLLAVPIAATLKVLVVEGVSYYKSSPLYAAAAPED